MLNSLIFPVIFSKSVDLILASWSFNSKVNSCSWFKFPLILSTNLLWSSSLSIVLPASSLIIDILPELIFIEAFLGSILTSSKTLFSKAIKASWSKSIFAFNSIAFLPFTKEFLANTPLSLP